MLVLGRRVAILKDTTVAALPSDLTGRIYKSIDLAKPKTVKVVNVIACFCVRE